MDNSAEKECVSSVLSCKAMYSDDLRWRIVSLVHIYDLEIRFLADIFGPNPRSIQRWYARFLKTGSVRDNAVAVRASRWPTYVVEYVEKYVKAHPTFYIEELQQHLRTHFPNVRNTLKFGFVM